MCQEVTDTYKNMKKRNWSRVGKAGNYRVAYDCNQILRSINQQMTFPINGCYRRMRGMGRRSLFSVDFSCPFQSTRWIQLWYKDGKLNFNKHTY